MIIQRLSRPAVEKKAIVISVNSSKAMTASNYSQVAKLIKKQQKKMNDTNLPKIQESMKSTMTKNEKKSAEEEGTFSLEEG